MERSDPAGAFASAGSCVGRLVDVQADAEHDRAVAQLRDPARHLAPVEHHVVRPLDLRGQPGRALDDDGRRHARDERQLRGAPLRRRSQEHRDEDGRARRLDPLPSEPPAAGRLVVRRRDRALGVVRPEQELRRLALRLVPPRLADHCAVSNSRSSRTAETLYSGVPISESPTSCVSQFTFASAKWSAIQTRPG